jgi:hypothetical protein
MISDFVIRDGQNGTANLSSTGRTSLPARAARAYNRSAMLIASVYGPNVSTIYPLGRYIEDNEYLGDLGKTLGVDFDLNKYNCRNCVTLEFPGGIMPTSSSSQRMARLHFSYNLGRNFYGDPTGNTVTSITETVTPNFIGGASAALQLNKPVLAGNTVTFVWNAKEGCTYLVESSGNLNAWTTDSSGIPAIFNRGTPATPTNQFFQVGRTALAAYDPN